MNKEARFWKPHNDAVQCLLCPHRCTIAPGKRGICGVRENDQGTLRTLIYGKYSSVAEDPIEKKPFNHFYPGSLVLSFGSVGCNLQCDHCQNASISTASPEEIPLHNMSPQQAIELAQRHRCAGIAWTYNEPTFWHEYTYDTAKLAKKEGLYTVYVTNGFINEEPLKEISPYLDAMNIDIKAFHEDFYKKICKARLEPVLQATELAQRLGIHLELTYLVIPTLNDSLQEIKQFVRWVIERIGAETPVHFSRFHPDHRLRNIPATPMDALLKIYDMAQAEGILYPYLGNIPHGNYENTLCPTCGNVLIERYGFSATISGLQQGKCGQCGRAIPIRGLQEKLHQEND